MMVSQNRLCENCGTPLYTLTERQAEVVQELVSHPQATVEELAEHLTISPYTLRNHLSAIYKQLGVSNRLGCVMACLSLGIIRWDELAGKISL